MVTARGIICPSQTEGKCQLETLLLLCFSVWIIIWTTDNLAHLTALTNESPNQLMHSAFSEMKKRRKHVKMSPDLKCVPAAATFSSVILCCGDELCQLSLLCNLIGTQRSIISDVHFPKVQTLMKGYHPLSAAFPRHFQLFQCPLIRGSEFLWDYF